jgi:hypothetical protein
MARTAKKLWQGALSNTLTARYTAPTSTSTQVCQIWLANTGTSSRTITISTHGTAVTNYIITGEVLGPNESRCIDDLKIVLAASEYLAAKQDTGTDVTMTLYGVETT